VGLLLGLADDDDDDDDEMAGLFSGSGSMIVELI